LPSAAARTAKSRSERKQRRRACISNAIMRDTERL
jgi:hypothetical protein